MSLAELEVEETVLSCRLRRCCFLFFFPSRRSKIMSVGFESNAGNCPERVGYGLQTAWFAKDSQLKLACLSWSGWSGLMDLWGFGHFQVGSSWSGWF